MKVRDRRVKQPQRKIGETSPLRFLSEDFFRQTRRVAVTRRERTYKYVTDEGSTRNAEIGEPGRLRTR